MGAEHDRSAHEFEDARRTAENIVCEIVSLSAGFQDIRSTWAGRVGISGPQLSILAVIASMDRGGGVSVKETASRMRVDPSFVTLCTKRLEKKGLLRRRVSPMDARLVMMSLTERASEFISEIADDQVSICRLIFAGFDDRKLGQLARTLNDANSLLEKAQLQAQLSPLRPRPGD